MEKKNEESEVKQCGKTNTKSISISILFSIRGILILLQLAKFKLKANSKACDNEKNDSVKIKGETASYWLPLSDKDK